MATWMNTDGLFVKLGTSEADVAIGGHYEIDGGRLMAEAIIDYTELLSATSAIVGSIGKPGSFGLVMPKGARIEAVETIANTAFTSSGTIGSATLELGLKKASDRSTALDHAGFLTTSFVGSSFDVVGERNYIVPGSTGAGALIGTDLSENGVLCARNSQHASHPYTAGQLKVRIYYFFKP